jgi:hypothetical protein
VSSNVVDPQGRSVAFVGSIMEHNAEAILSVRLKLQDRVIQEIEQIMVHNPQGATAWDSRTLPGTRAYTTAGWNDTLTPADRSPRDRMLAIANSYFSAIQGGEATPAPIAPGCYRIENGEVTAGAPKTGLDAPRATDPNAVAGQTCAEQLGVKGLFVFNNELRDRRFSVVDEEKGIVFSHVFFDHAGKYTTMTAPDGTQRPVGLRVALPNTLAIHEIFWIKNGLIQHVAASILVVPYGMPSGWEN